MRLSRDWQQSFPQLLLQTNHDLDIFAYAFVFAGDVRTQRLTLGPSEGKIHGAFCHRVRVLRGASLCTCARLQCPHNVLALQTCAR